MDCLFCKIARKEISAHIVYEDDAVVAFLDLHPRAEGHTVVIPKRHAETILDVPKEGLGPLFSGVQAVTAMVQKACLPDGFTIGINHGKASGQTIDHLHIHIIPRSHTDGGTSIHGVVNSPSAVPLAEIAKKIIND
jgi:histidine triad (HIT) family protein